MLTDLFKSKKFTVLIVSIVVYGVGRAFGMENEDAAALVAVVSSYLVGQGIADHGKEAAKLKGGES